MVVADDRQKPIEVAMGLGIARTDLVHERRDFLRNQCHLKHTLPQGVSVKKDLFGSFSAILVEGNFQYLKLALTKAVLVLQGIYNQGCLIQHQRSVLLCLFIGDVHPSILNQQLPQSTWHGIRPRHKSDQLFELSIADVTFFVRGVGNRFISVCHGLESQLEVIIVLLFVCCYNAQKVVPIEHVAVIAELGGQLLHPPLVFISMAHVG
mmetsp:Transcript_11711/g.26498  ORF Transcript_11711/g.26498 Transcript_11711/m.26498 type:complete len:208 (-) Transcript_11711:3658-4281(-)